jgi:hypothetical protein
VHFPQVSLIPPAYLLPRIDTDDANMKFQLLGSFPFSRVSCEGVTTDRHDPAGTRHHETSPEVHGPVCRQNGRIPPV